MAKLHLQGYLTGDEEGIIALSKNNPTEAEYSWERYGNSIIDDIYCFAKECGIAGEHNNGLGGKISYIDNCNMRMYFTDSECDLKDAMEAMDVVMYGGDIKTKTNWYGYSEWTIIGLNLDTFTIGGHDLNKELNNHYGQYVHIIIEC